MPLFLLGIVYVIFLPVFGFDWTGYGIAIVFAVGFGLLLHRSVTYTVLPSESTG